MLPVVASAVCASGITVADSHTLRLSFAAGEKSLTVREFAVREALGEPFEIEIVALSDRADVSLEKLVGTRADFYLTSLNPTQPERMWSGVVAEIAQTYAAGREAGSNEQSAYRLRLAPKLWLLSQRREQRIFQQLSAPAIVKKILGEWQIEAEWKLTRGDEHYPKRDYTVQYGESDLAFVSRVCEAAGISYLFRFVPGETKLVFCDEPEKGPERLGMPIPAFDEPPPETPPEYLTAVSLRHATRPGAVTVRDYEFRKQASYPLAGKGRAGARAPEDFAEQYSYEPGAFLVDSKEGPTTPVADDRGMQPRHDGGEAKRLAARRIHELRKSRRSVGFATNCPDLAPGTRFRMSGHPRPELAGALLVTSFTLSGGASGEWTMAGQAALCDAPWLPDRKTPKPRILGAQSAVVVGPKGGKNPEIHTDEHGRVRVQFHWDREGKYDDKSSCWLRVSQDWAGAGYGKLHLPRVGQEVIVGFYEGDPDQPVVIGSVYNELNQVPYKLPEHKTRSAWKSDSSPRGDKPAFNELMFEDKGGAELVYQQAERDLQKLVKKYETERTGVDRLAIVGGERRAVLGELDAAMVGKRWLVEAIEKPGKDDLRIQEQQKPKVKPTHTMADAIDKRIIFTTGKATVSFEHANLRIEADGSISVKAAGADCIIEGKHVYINTKEPPKAATPDPFDPLEPATFGYQPRKTKGEWQPAEMRALAKAPGTRPEQIEARKRLADEFYKTATKFDRDSGKLRPLTRDERTSEMKGIDFDQPVIVGPHHRDRIPGGLTQWQAPGGKRGGYFAHEGTPPPELGIHHEARMPDPPGGGVVPKVKKSFELHPDTPYIQSTAAPARDDWSLSYKGPDGKWVTTPVDTPGGGTQYFTTHGRDPGSPYVKGK